MSNSRTATRKPPAKKKAAGGSLAKYRQDAGGEPFPFEVDDDRVIDIPRPTGKTLMDLAEKYAGLDPNNLIGVDPREQFQDLLGETYEEIMPILEAEDFKVMVLFMKDLIEYFDLGEALASLA